jgi:hypothetical protein
MSIEVRLLLPFCMVDWTPPLCFQSSLHWVGFNQGLIVLSVRDFSMVAWLSVQSRLDCVCEQGLTLFFVTSLGYQGVVYQTSYLSQGKRSDPLIIASGTWICDLEKVHQNIVMKNTVSWTFGTLLSRPTCSKRQTKHFEKRIVKSFRFWVLTTSAVPPLGRS